MEFLATINHAPKGDISMIPQKQLSLADIFEDCKEIYESNKPRNLRMPLNLTAGKRNTHSKSDSHLQKSKIPLL